jgi:TonB-linked SusC/RagA family outer membrane protein
MKKIGASYKLTFIDFSKKNLFFTISWTFVLMFLSLTATASKNNSTVSLSGIKTKIIAVRGEVTASTGEGLPGVNVTIKGTNMGTKTDATGSYSLSNVPENGVLVFLYLGYQIKEVQVNGQATINVVLVPNITSLEEVVVVGYGTVQRKDLTGSVGSVSGAKIQDLAVTRADQALMGKLGGVQVKAISGAPGAAPQIKIRGGASISAGGNPLYVVDGFPAADLLSLSPGDIESMDVLKDASATAIYGSRGANGVVIINTKRGASGPPKISFGSYFGYQITEKFPAMQTAMEQAEHYFVGIRNVNLDNGNDITGPVSGWKVAVPLTIRQLMSGQPLTAPGTTTNFADPRDFIYRTAPKMQYQLSATGGSENVKYAVSGEFADEDGTLINTNFKRFSTRINLDAKLSNKLALKLNMNPSYRKIYDSGDNVAPLQYASQIPSYYAIYKPDGSYEPFGNGLDAVVSSFNPVALAMEPIHDERSFGFIGNINAEYTFTKDLKLNVLFGTNFSTSKEYLFKPKLPSFQDALANGRDGSQFTSNWLQESSLNYNKGFGKHSMSLLGLFSTQKQTGFSNQLTSNQFANNLIPFLSGAGNLISTGTGDVSEWSLVSYLGRMNYNYNNRYYFTASYRADGSSRFGGNNKFGFFPSAALAWRASEEAFLKDITWLSNLKVRISYGVTGNNNIGDYAAYATVNPAKATFGGVAVAGYAPGSLPNRDLTWETVKSYNGGLDIGMFNNRVSVTLDYFKSENSNLLLSVNVPRTLGFNSFLTNIGRVDNQGFEIVLGTVNFNNAFKWSTDFNISHSKNKVIKLGPSGDPIISGGNITQIGSPIGMFFGWNALGVVQSAAQLAKVAKYLPGQVLGTHVGDVYFEDINGDGVIDATNDKKIVASPYPDFYYGINNTFSYKAFSLDIGIQGSKGGKVYQLDRGQMTNDRARFRQLSIMNGYFKSEAEPGNGFAPRPSDTPTGNWRGTLNTTFLDTGSYLRVNSIVLGYKLPDVLTSKLRLTSARVYVNASNPLTFTNNISWNPDVSRGSNNLQPSTQQFDYPLNRSLVMGLNIGF